MSKLVSIEEAVAHVKDGMTLMIGGFLGAGTGVKMVEAIANKGVKDLTLICNDTAYPNKFIGMLIANKQVKKLYASHIGTNADTIQQFNEKTLDIAPHEFTYSIIGHPGALDGTAATTAADLLNQRKSAYVTSKHAGSLGKSFSLFSSDGSIRVKAVKKAEDGDGIIIADVKKNIIA